MNTYSYDLPLQHLVKAKLNTPKLPQLLASPINFECQVDTEQTSKYDLPCRRNNDQFLMPKYSDNKTSVKNNSCDMSKYVNNKSRDFEVDLSKHILTTVETNNAQHIRMRVGSIYEKLLEENKKRSDDGQIVTQATFKPRELKRTLSQQCQRSMGENSSRPHQERGRTNSQSKSLFKDKKTNCVKKLDYEKEVKTKYQKILEEHFQTKFSSKRSDAITVEDIRLSKICGKNSAILKLKQKLEPKIATDNTRTQIAQMKQKLGKVTREPQILKPKASLQKKANVRDLKQNDHNQLKKSQSQRWMSMNFHQRQQRVLENRKQKQAIGKQQKFEEEIKPCTFKPEIVTKIKPQKNLQPQKNSYLNQYYQKIYRKY